jgi:Glycosyl hydrolases family 2, TIM barrel domain/Glycosyl hydrolases family 2, sugar binding domain/Glycosyl hydrolases family 2
LIFGGHPSILPPKEGVMERWTRRGFLSGTAQTAAAAALLGTSCGPRVSDGADDDAFRDGGQAVVSLDGPWLFRTDPEKRGEARDWASPGAAKDGWDEVVVPSTWQVAEKTADYMGVAWYRREFHVPSAWRKKVVRVEFEAVFHTAEVFVNGKRAGEHIGKGYTAFTIDISGLVQLGGVNTIAVRVDNSFAQDMLPRGNSYDWTPDGGLTRPVHLIVTPQVYIERLWVDAVPDLAAGTAELKVTAVVRNATAREAGVELDCLLREEASGAVLKFGGLFLEEAIPAGASREIRIAWDLDDVPVKLWHFDHPHVYVLEASISRRNTTIHKASTTFGVRKIEVRGTEFLLNGEPVRLAGVERMAGSHPDFGMAEPEGWIAHDHDDLKELNCVFTRVHWPQDRRVLDYCDRKGILIQLEVPTWGAATFDKLGGDLLEKLTANGLEQLREMIARDRNHPCIFSWGLCNEVDGQNPVAQAFVRRMLGEAKRLDPARLCSYASNSLQSTPERDVAGEMDFIEWNEYYETWYGGDPAMMRENLEAIHRAFPAKPIVISEYGYCACTAARPEDDARRARILETHNAVFRDYPWVGGFIFFDYNDYRTHMGDKGEGVFKQRVHGVVDVLGGRKPSFDVLRQEASPIGSIEAQRKDGLVQVVIRTRKDLPAYTLRGYALRWTSYGKGAIPLGRGEAPLPDLAPGDLCEQRFDPEGMSAVLIEVVRPTGFSAAAKKLALRT